MDFHLIKKHGYQLLRSVKESFLSHLRQKYNSICFDNSNARFHDSEKRTMTDYLH
jgi:hypothetical protein